MSTLRRTDETGKRLIHKCSHIIDDKFVEHNHLLAHILSSTTNTDCNGTHYLMIVEEIEDRTYEKRGILQMSFKVWSGCEGHRKVIRLA
jgi:hypothetical protein